MGAVGATGRPLVIGETFRPGDDYSVGGQVYSGNTGQVIGNLGEVERVPRQEAIQRDQRLAEQRQQMERARAERLQKFQQQKFAQEMAQRQQMAASQSSVPAASSAPSPQQRASVEEALARYQQEQGAAKAAAEQRLAEAKAREAEMRNRAEYERARQSASYEQARSERDRARAESEARMQRGIAGIDRGDYTRDPDAVRAAIRADLENRQASMENRFRQNRVERASELNRMRAEEMFGQQQRQQTAASPASPEGFQLGSYEELLKRLQAFRGNQ